MCRVIGAKKENLLQNKTSHRGKAANFATHSELSLEIKDLEQIKGPERYLNID